MCISDLTPCELITLASSLSIAISKEMSVEDIAILSAFFSALGDNLAILALQ